jgi:hypothetical protein
MAEAFFRPPLDTALHFGGSADEGGTPAARQEPSVNYLIDVSSVTLHFEIGVQMLPSVTKAKYIKDYLIEVKFNDGSKKVIDFGPWLTGPIFKPLKNKNYFKRFLVDGPTIAWPNGADIAPETLYKAATVKPDSNSKIQACR